MSLRDRIEACNRFDPGAFLPFEVEGQMVGAIRRDRVPVLAGCTGFLDAGPGRVALASSIRGPEARSRALAEIVRVLVDRGEVRRLKGEEYAVSGADGTRLLTLDRAAVPYFGVRGQGIHVNGYVRRPDGGLDMWLGVRAKSKTAHPGKLDNMVAGGQPAHLSIIDNLVKEAAEEASIPEDLARRATAAGVITYCLAVPGGLRPDTVHCFDLELPVGFVPEPHDGEVERFERWPVEDVLDIVRRGDRFKFNCNLVVIDFALRHGLVAPEDGDAAALRRALSCPAPYEAIRRAACAPA